MTISVCLGTGADDSGGNTEEDEEEEEEVVEAEEEGFGREGDFEWCEDGGLRCSDCKGDGKCVLCVEEEGERECLTDDEEEEDGNGNGDDDDEVEEEEEETEAGICEDGEIDGTVDGCELRGGSFLLGD